MTDKSSEQSTVRESGGQAGALSGICISLSNINDIQIST